MSVKFSLARLRNPQDPEGPRKLYACAQVREEISLDRIAEEIAFSSSLTEGDVLNVLRGLAQNVVNHLADGDLVDLGDLGRFCYKLSSEGVDRVKDFSEDKIRRVRLHYRPGRIFQNKIPDLKFEYVISRKAQDEAKRAEREAQDQAQESQGQEP